MGSGPWALLWAVLTLELCGMAYFAVTAGLNLANTQENPVQDLIAVFVISLVGLALLLAVFVGALRKRSWARAAALTVQVGVFAVALSFFQGVIGHRAIGFVLLAVALVGGYATIRVRPVVLEAGAAD